MIEALVGQNHMVWWWLPWILLIPLILFVIGIMICLWVYRDAESRGMNGALWVIIVIFTNIIGLIIYLIVRESKLTAPPQRITQICPQCGYVLYEEANFCPHCGKSLVLPKSSSEK